MKVRITLLEEALGSSPSNEDLLGTYIVSKALGEGRELTTLAQAKEALER